MYLHRNFWRINNRIVLSNKWYEYVDFGLCITNNVERKLWEFFHDDVNK